MYERYIKRALDIIAAIILMLLTLPLFIAIAIAIKITSPGAVIFKQRRTGRNGKEFFIYKFRTMCSKNDVKDSSKENEITALGGVLRSLSLDEIPQLINVIKGEMSFIGPRPWIPEYYDNMDSNQRQRYNARPGVTGLAQAFGRNNLTIHQKIAYDLRYVNNVTPYEDIKVIYITICSLFIKDNGHEISKSGIHDELRQLKEGLVKNKKVVG